MGIAAAIMNKRAIGRRQRGRLIAAEIGTVWTILQVIGVKPRRGEGKRSEDGRKTAAVVTQMAFAQDSARRVEWRLVFNGFKWKLTWPFKSKPFQ
jgi:hypothetical protein